MKRKVLTSFTFIFLLMGLILGFTTMSNQSRDPRHGARQQSNTKQVPIIQNQTDNGGNGNVVSGIPYYTDNFNGANDTTALKSRGYFVYYRGAGPQGVAATWFQGNPDVFFAYNGPDSGYVAANYQVVTATNDIDSWLVLPSANVTAGDQIAFYEQSPSGSIYPDSVRVMYSASGSTTPEGTWVELGRFKTTITGTWTRRSFVAPSSGATARYAIRYAVVAGGPSGLNSDFVGFDALTLESPFPNNNDVKPQAFINPTNGGTVGINVNFAPQASFTNNGNNNQTNVPVRYRIINASNVVVYNNTAVISSLLSGETQTATFPNATITAAGTYTIKAISELVGDQAPSNDTITGTISTSGSLSGNYLIGAVAFNSASGKNITFKQVVTKSVKEVWETDNSNISKENYQPDANKEAAVVNGRLVKKVVEEISYVPMENGVEYTGRLFAENTGDGVGGAYPTLTAAVNDLNTLGASGPVNFILIDPSYPSETYPIVINSYPGNSSTNTLTIKPNTGVGSTLTGSTVSGLIKLNGADYVTIDGLNTGGASLTLNNTNTGGINLWIASAGASNGSTNNTIRNTVFNGPSIGGILAGSGTTLGADAESPNSNNSITNSSFSNTQNAMYLRGNTTTLDQNWVVTGNTVGSAVDATKHTFRGIAILNSANANVSLNNIAGVLSGLTSTATVTGISTFVNISGGSISRNRISDIYQRNTGGWGANGIGLNSTSTASNLIVANNFISGVRGYGYTGGAGAADNGYGIIISAGGGYNVYYNTIALNVSQNVAGLPAAFNVTSGVVTAGGLNIRNNIFQNTQTTATERYSVYSGAANTVYAAINYNDYYTTGPNLGFLGSNRVNLAGWQAATGQDANSASVLVNFVDVSTNNLHLAGASIGNASLYGTLIPAVTIDIDGNARVIPYKGADEATSNLTLKFNFEACPNVSPITVQLRSSTSPYNLVEQVSGNGGGNTNSSIGFANAVNGTPYYVVVKSVNMMETWSATTVVFTSSNASYDFTTALSQAFGANQVLSAGIPSVYQGDANQDGVIDLTDLTLTYNDASTFNTSPATDFDCNGVTDLTDIVIVFNNANAFVSVEKPL